MSLVYNTYIKVGNVYVGQKEELIISGSIGLIRGSGNFFFIQR